MKHPLLFVAFLLLPLLCFSQGVKFEQGSWKEALALAKQSDKPVCLYLYASDDTSYNNQFVFSLETVGKLINPNFVSFRIDASTDEGLMMARTYHQIGSNVLFFTADGTLLSHLRYISDNEFMESANKVLLDLKETKPIMAWMAEFPQKKNDPTFLLEYMNKRGDLGLPINEAFDAYLRLLPATGPIPVEAADLFDRNCVYMMVTDYAYSYFFANRKAYQAALATLYNREPIDENYCVAFQHVVMNTVYEAALFNDEALLKKAVEAFRQIPRYSDKMMVVNERTAYSSEWMMQVEELYLNYYNRTNEKDQYLVHARLFAEDNLKKLASDSLLFMNHVGMKRLNQAIASGTVSADGYKKALLTMERNFISNQLSSIAHYVFSHFSDTAVLQEALVWSDSIIQYRPTVSSFLQINAFILEKLGRKKEAIKMQKLAVANNTRSALNSVYSENLKLMEARK